MGPIAVPKEHLSTNLRVQTWVNGEKRQDATLDQLIFNIPTLIACLSQAQTLQPGDTIATGTPVGVGFGFRPMKFLRPGDEVRVSVTGLGTLVNRIAMPDAPNTTVERIQSPAVIPQFNQKARQRNGLLKVGGKELFYQFRGREDGPPIIFIHGLGGSSSYFTPLVMKLAATHALYMIDLEGHGLSPTSAASKITVASLAADIRSVFGLARPDRKPATVVAHSMGCLVAMKLALEQPKLIAGLILMGPPPSPLPPAARSGGYARAETVRSQGMIAVVDDILDAGLSSASRTTNPLAVTATRLSLLGQDPEGYAKACTALAESADEALDTARLTCRTLILTGSDDAVSPPAVCHAYATAIESSRVEVLNGVGHWHLLEDARGTTDAVVSFLTGHQ